MQAGIKAKRAPEGSKNAEHAASYPESVPRTNEEKEDEDEEEGVREWLPAPRAAQGE